MKFRWIRGSCGLLCIYENSVVGTVDCGPRGERWWAYGCDVDWQDVDLGTHESQAKAKSAVLAWVGARI
jgi:hypothetical protein